MIHIHPFPARMAPEIALNKLSELQEGKTVLDPMSGSGMVLSVAARRKLIAVGVDLDPLARLISLTGATKVVDSKAILSLEKLLELSRKAGDKEFRIPWIDDDLETQKFIDYWFAEKQIRQLRVLSYYLICMPLIRDWRIKNVLLVALSRLIITKEPKASLARDTAHSRPHRTITQNEFDIFEAMPKSLSHVLRALDADEVKVDARTYLGDARSLTRVKNEEIDVIVTSPPYLNAIDYMRGHKFSLVWFGYRISELRRIRGTAIGAERAIGHRMNREFRDLSRLLRLNDLEPRKVGILERYFGDLCLQLNETQRVLKKGATASYVIGNSEIHGKIIENSELIKRAGNLAGLDVISEVIRDIPDKRRYLPMIVHSSNSLSKRMRTEHIVSFSKKV